MMYDVQTMARTHLRKMRSDARTSGILASVLHATLDLLIAILLIAYVNEDALHEEYALRFSSVHVVITLVWLLIAHLIVIIGLLACARHGSVMGLVYYIVRFVFALVVMIVWPYKLIWLRRQEAITKFTAYAEHQEEMSSTPTTVTMATTTLVNGTNNATEMTMNAPVVDLGPSTEITEYTIGLFIGILCALLALVVFQTVTAWLFAYMSRGLYKEYYRSVRSGNQGGRALNNTSLHWHQTTAASSQIDQQDEGKDTRHTLYPQRA